MRSVILVAFIIIKILNNEGCDIENYIDASLIDKDGTPSYERFHNCRISNLYLLNEVRVDSCLNHLREETFTNLPELEVISTVELCIKKLSPGFFERTPKLMKVLLRSNHIEAIEGSTFRNSIIDHIELSYNRIQTIGDYAFGNMPNVLLLDLEHNQLHEIGEDWFAESNIKRLNLANNKITRIRKTTFNKIRSLEVMNLEYNRIHRIDNDVKVNNLQNLLLAGNWLTDTDFSRNLKVAILDISFNKISYINILNVALVQQLVMQPNPWQCACLRKFWKDNVRYNIMVEDSMELKQQWDSNTPVCIAPHDQGFACTFTKDERFSSAQETYFISMNYADFGKYS